jgi:hypothetical protein
MPTDYNRQFLNVQQATLKSFEDEQKQIRNQQDAAKQALSIAKNEREHASAELDDAVRRLRVTGTIHRKLINVQVAAGDAVTTITRANAIAVESCTAIADVVSTIRGASEVIDTVIKSVNGIAGVTSRHAPNHDVTKAAIRARQNIEEVAREMEDARKTALEATIALARNSTTAALESTQEGKAKIDELLAGAETALTSFNEAVTAAIAARHTAKAAYSDKKTQSELLSAYDSALTEIRKASQSASGAKEVPADASAQIKNEKADGFYVTQLNKRKDELTEAEKNRLAAETTRQALLDQQSARQSELTRAQAEATTARDAFLAIEIIAQLNKNAQERAQEYKSNVDDVAGMARKLITNSSRVSEKAIKALNELDSLVTEVATSAANHDPIASHVPDAAQVLADAQNAFSALLVAYQKAALAHKMVSEGGEVTELFLDVKKEAKKDAKEKDARNSVSSLLGDKQEAAKGSLPDLLRSMKDKALVPLLQELAKVTQDRMKSRRDAANVAAREVNTANAKFNKETANAKSATAAVAAAQAAVA